MRPEKNTSLFSVLNTREKILLSLLAVGAVVEDILDDLYTPITIGRAVNRLYSFEDEVFQERRKTTRNTLFALAAKKLITKAGARTGSFQLTEEGLNYLFEKFPKLKYGGRSWDGYWRVVVYDIAEKETRLRDRLRLELKHLGFKFLQKSVWLSPYAVEKELEEFLRRERLWGKILTFKALLPPEETRRLKQFFQETKVNKKKQEPGVAAAVENLLNDPHLPQGL